jgi:NAD(P)-dependent dehydrogenase (short-subunit alcohol dehydrogenase family)
MFFSDKICIVTGAASGIGKALAIQLAAQGASVICCDKDESGLLHTKEFISALYGTCTCVCEDLSRPGVVRRIVEDTVSTHKRLDCLFNIAGMCVAEEITDITDDQWDRCTGINFRAIVEGSTAAYRVMKKQGSGHIINMSSAAGLYVQPGTAAYTATKHAVHAFSLCLRVEAKAFGVNVTTLFPGYIDTAIFKNTETNGLDWREMKKAVPFPMLSPDHAAGKILSAVKANKAMAVFPFHARIFWWISRLNPAWHLFFAQFLIRDFRKLSRKANP